MSKEVLHIDVRESLGTRVITLTGELDAFTSGRLIETARRWVGDAGKIVINLDGVQYIDSSGLSALVWLWLEAKERGTELGISCLSPRVHRVLEITGLLKLFTPNTLPVRSIPTMIATPTRHEARPRRA
ncbi:MAG: STAS domain-containing protein [Armatimonadota bacterium]